MKMIKIQMSILIIIFKRVRKQYHREGDNKIMDRH